METAFPFFSNHPDDAGSAIYHTHPRCRVAQQIPAEVRAAGTGENRGECPFCFLLAQFQANRGLRGPLPMGGSPPRGVSGADTALRPLRAPTLHY
ncbi:hypothetical protein ABIB44_002408 [Hymenobacter sp. UYCo722]